ncbi:MAG: TonB-dependent receptor plug domain-containing protein, partial [Bacteroidia bacterium]|nr:TonB-dependent receptor plug domain-containing protein [Bacteroidia bacterium]
MSEKTNSRCKKTAISLKNILLTFGFCTINIISLAQISLSGTITGKNQTLKGASVYIADLKTGTITNEDGTYLIKNIPNGIYLAEVSFIGFASQIKEVKIKGKSISNFNLEASSIESPEVIVTGVAVATDQHTTPAPINIITPNFLQETGFNNIIDALKYSPGVSQITQGPAISKPVIRGLGYNRVVVVNDGIRQEGQQFGDEFGIEADPYSINKIEILRGPASLSYGSDAMAGVINMLAAPTVPEGKIKGNIQSNFQTNNGLYGGSANIEGNLNGITFDARYTHTDAHAYKNKNDGYVFNSGYGQNNFKGSVGINRNWGFSRITLSSFNLNLGIVEGGRDPVTGQFNQHLMAADGTDSVAIVPDALLKSYTHNLIIHQNVKHYKAIWDNSFAIGNGRLGFRLGFQQNHRQEANDATLGN